MDVDALRELTDIFKHRWDPIILALLSASPHRRRELTHQVRDKKGEHISDGVLSQTLSRLTEEGLIDKEQRGVNHVIYSATPAAIDQVERLRRQSARAAQVERPH
jgi:DNA-binding HxlR family transcriptional regulator